MGGFGRRCWTPLRASSYRTRPPGRLLGNLGLGASAVNCSGDTRFDRVLEISGALPVAAAFADGWTVIVAGSTWDEDEKELAHFVRLHPNIRFIIAPHEISKDHIRAIQHTFPESVRPLHLSAWATHARCLIVADNIGTASASVPIRHHRLCGRRLWRRRRTQRPGSGGLGEARGIRSCL